MFAFFSALVTPNAGTGVRFTAPVRHTGVALADVIGSALELSLHAWICGTDAFKSVPVSSIGWPHETGGGLALGLAAALIAKTGIRSQNAVAVAVTRALFCIEK